MNQRDVASSIGCCGRLCSFCKDRAYCDGCRSHDGKCARHNQFDGCFQYSCSHRKGLQGCWECGDAPCAKDMFIQADACYLKAFIHMIQTEGVDAFATHAFLSYCRGVKISDYEACEEEADVEALIKGKKTVKN